MLRTIIKYSLRQLKKTFSKAYVTSLVIAFLLWSLIKFSALYQERLTFKVQLNDLPESHVLLGNYSQKVNCTIKTTGFRIFLLKYWKSEILEIDFEDLIKMDSLKYRINLLDISRKKQPNWIQNADQIQYENTELVFEIEELVKRKLKIVPKINLTFKHGYILDFISLSTDSVTVLLPKSLADVSSIETYEKNISNLSKSESIELFINLPTSWKLIGQSKKIESQIYVDQLTQGVFNLPIHRNNGVDIKYFPSRVEVKYSIPSKQFNSINPEDIIVQAEAPYSESNENEALKIHVSSKPKSVQILSINPSEVEFLIFDNE